MEETRCAGEIPYFVALNLISLIPQPPPFGFSAWRRFRSGAAFPLPSLSNRGYAVAPRAQFSRCSGSPPLPLKEEGVGEGR